MALGDDIALLSRAPLLSLLDPDALRLLAFAADRRALAPGDVLFRRGDPADGGYVVASGALALDAGRGAPPFLAEAGTLIGKTALLTAARRPATATASAPSVVLHVSTSLMHRTLREFPDGARRLQAAVAEELAATAEGLARVRARLLALDGES